MRAIISYNGACAGMFLNIALRSVPGLTSIATSTSNRQPVLRLLASRGLPSWVVRPGLRRGGTLPEVATGGGRGSGGGKPPCATAARGPGDEAGGLWGKYLESLETHPLLTRATTCGLLTALGDTFCQLAVEGVQLDPMRVMTISCLGFMLTGPVLYQLYIFIAQVAPGTSLRSVLTAVALDQFVFQPAWIALVMSILTVAEGKGDVLQQKLKQDWLPAVKVSWLIWIPAQFINFKFVPLHLRVTFDAVVALCWNVYLSFQSHKAIVA